MKKNAVTIILLTFIFFIFTGCSDKAPQIVHGEFPFRLKYEYNGETYEINDTVICDFNDFDTTSGIFTLRSWEECLESGRDRFTITLTENEPSVLDPDRINETSELYLAYGSSDYYMGDPNSKGNTHLSPHFCYVETYAISEKVSDVDTTIFTEDQLQEYFGLKIIEWEFSEPIKNTFE